MQYINEKMWIDLGEFLDMESFDSIHEEIIRKIAKNYNSIQTSGTPHSTLFDKTKKSFFEEKKINKSLAVNKDFSDKELDLYTRLDSVATLGSQLVLRGNRGYPESYRYKHLNEYSFETPCSVDFQFLFNWLTAQACFDEIGRVMFWINEPEQRTVLHTDYGNKNSTRKDMFIWITGINPKSMILYDDHTGVEHIVDSRACIFNNNNWHCSKGNSLHTSWSLRIDGVFNADWARAAGLAEYFGLV
jgi:hypothetical protein